MREDAREIDLTNALFDDDNITEPLIDALKHFPLLTRVSLGKDRIVTLDERKELCEAYPDIEFNAVVYVSKVMEAIRSAEHVTDVWIDEEATPRQGVFLACHNSDGTLMPMERIARMRHTASGYLRQSSGKGDEEQIPNFRQALKLSVDGQ